MAYVVQQPYAAPTVAYGAPPVAPPAYAPAPAPQPVYVTPPPQPAYLAPPAGAHGEFVTNVKTSHMDSKFVTKSNQWL